MVGGKGLFHLQISSSSEDVTATILEIGVDRSSKMVLIVEEKKFNCDKA